MYFGKRRSTTVAALKRAWPLTHIRYVPKYVLYSPFPATLERNTWNILRGQNHQPLIHMGTVPCSTKTRRLYKYTVVQVCTRLDDAAMVCDEDPGSSPPHTLHTTLTTPVLTSALDISCFPGLMMKYINLSSPPWFPFNSWLSWSGYSNCKHITSALFPNKP